MDMSIKPLSNISGEFWRRLRAQALIVLVSLVSALWIDDQGWLERLEFAIYDFRQTQIRAETVIADQVKVVLIDESSLDFMAESLGSFPWPRTVYAELLEFFELGGAKAVLFDILFTEPDIEGFGATAGGSEHDIRLAEASARFSGTVHSLLLNRDIEDLAVATLNRPLPDFMSERFALSGIDNLTGDGLNAFTLPIEQIAENTPHVGVVGVDPDSDGVYRRVKPLWEYQRQVYPGLSLTPLVMDKPRLALDNETNLLLIDKQAVALDERNRLLVNYYGDMQPISIASVFQTWDKIMAGELADLPLDPYEFEDAIVYIGASAIGLDDIKAVTNDPKAPGVYIHAAAASNMLIGDVMRPEQRSHTLILAALGAIVSVIFAFNVPNYLFKVTLLVLMAIGYWLFSGWQLASNQQVALVVPTLSYAFGWTWSFTYLSFTEGASKRRVKRMLSQYVSEAMLNQAMESPDDILHAGVGEQETLTILFSDVRGFTKLSESLPAERVVALLNCHFSEMAEVIFDNQGTLDKFIGDAIMAFWGMPIKVEQHADFAVKASIDMIDALTRVNAELAEKGLPSIEIGIGLNTGQVILGNIGSDRKLDYTVIGDPVNVASRMEGITKNYGVPIVISETTRLAMTSPRPCILLDKVRVKGKTEPLAIYTPCPNKEEKPESWVFYLQQEAISQQAFAYYQTQQWDKAEVAFKTLEYAEVQALYLSRIREFRRDPPPENWDGVYTFTSK